MAKALFTESMLNALFNEAMLKAAFVDAMLAMQFTLNSEEQKNPRQSTERTPCPRQR